VLSFHSPAASPQSNNEEKSSSKDAKQQAKEAKKARKRQRLAEKRKQKKWGATSAAVAAAQPQVQDYAHLNESNFIERITNEPPVAATITDWANSSSASIPSLSESVMQRYPLKRLADSTSPSKYQSPMFEAAKQITDVNIGVSAANSTQESEKKVDAEIGSNTLQSLLSGKHSWLKNWILKQNNSPPRAHFTVKSPNRHTTNTSVTEQKSSHMWESTLDSPTRTPELAVQSPERPVPPSHPRTATATNPFDSCPPTPPSGNAFSQKTKSKSKFNSDSNTSADLKENPFDRYDFTDYFTKWDKMQATITTSMTGVTKNISSSTEKGMSPHLTVAPHSSNNLMLTESKSPKTNILALESYWLSPLAAASSGAVVASVVPSIPAPAHEVAWVNALATPAAPAHSPPVAPKPATTRAFITTSIDSNEDSEEEAEKTDRRYLEEVAAVCKSTVLLPAKVVLDKSCSPIPVSVVAKNVMFSAAMLPNVLDVSQTSASNATQTEDVQAPPPVAVVSVVGHGVFGALSRQLERERTTYRRQKHHQADSYVSQHHQVLEQLPSPSDAQIYVQHKDIYFSRRAASFGAAAIGSVSRLKVELCNPRDTEATLYIQELPLPFVVLHKEIQLGARAYVRLPVRFVPTASHRAEVGPYACDLIVSTADGHSASIALEAASFLLGDK